MFISVVMAVYNEERYVAKAIISILNQTYNNFEFIIVNDGSTDNTKYILQQFPDSRIKVIDLPVNVGVARARNIGVEHAAGEWIAVQDADDISLPTRLEECVKFIEENPNISAVSSLIECIPGREPIVRGTLLFEEEIYNRFDNKESVKKGLFFGCPICHGSVIFSKAVFNQVGGYNVRYKIGHDYDLWIQMSKILPIEKLNKKLYQFRVNRQSVSRSNIRETSNEVILISTLNICNLLKQQLEQVPHILIFCTEKSYRNFRKKIKPKISSRMAVFHYYIYKREKDMKRAYSLYRKEKFAGLIVLDFQDSYQALQYFRNKGMKTNQNVFHIWNVTY